MCRGNLTHSTSYIINIRPMGCIWENEKSNNEHKRNQAVDSTLKALKEDEEFDGIGLNVACKLRCMEQKLLAEMLINEVLRNGVKGRLQEETNLCALKFIQSKIPARAQKE
ncbi:hypothetical protein HHI36_000572 [Cryptolaemus montrouzieri]|uniref:Uncharacterized protein n=1 Tax=Cryptolaemus montrouzieri TaxID=559131 RepID=A0ABD2P5H8_9CUCU